MNEVTAAEVWAFLFFFLGSSLIFKPVEFPFVGSVEGRLATQTTNGIVGRTDG